MIYYDVMTERWTNDYGFVKDQTIYELENSEYLLEFETEYDFWKWYNKKINIKDNMMMISMPIRNVIIKHCTDNFSDGGPSKWDDVYLVFDVPGLLGDVNLTVHFGKVRYNFGKLWIRKQFPNLTMISFIEEDENLYN